MLVTLQNFLCDNLPEFNLPTQSVLMLECGTERLTHPEH
jgi:hypothetical protein